jgi:hypothetical protein
VKLIESVAEGSDDDISKAGALDANPSAQSIAITVEAFIY